MLRPMCLLVGLTLSASAFAEPNEADVLREWNAVRADPPGYAYHLEAWLPLFQGLEFSGPSGRILTIEGPAAVREAIAVLKATPPMPQVQVSAGMTLAAREHANDLGPRGGRGHVGTDGSTLGGRLERHGQWQGTVFEAIAFGATTAHETILELLVDDGTPSRGHRTALLYPQGAFVGVACGEHRDYRSMCVLDIAGQFVEADQVPKARPAPVDPNPFDESKPFASPTARVPTGAPTPLDLAVFAEVNALRTDPQAWAAKLEALLPLFEGSILRRPGRTAMFWSNAPESVHQAIAMLKATAPQPPAVFLPSLAAGARDYVRVRWAHPAFLDRNYSALDAVRRYGWGPLCGALTMQGEGEAFDIIATWVVQGQGPNRTLLQADASQVGVACGPSSEYPLRCALVYAKGFADYDEASVAPTVAAVQRLDAARTNPAGEAARWRQLLPLTKGETLRLPQGTVPLPGGSEALEKLIARLAAAKPLPALKPSADLQERARDLVRELTPGRVPGDAGSWRMRPASSYRQTNETADPDELTLFAPGTGEMVALRVLLERPDWLLTRDEVSVGLWCGGHATKGQVCVVDVAVGWVAAGPELP
ncbi:MAG: CAP domain-containing protein [Myxococcota bacterium]